MKALTLAQPVASAMLIGGKRIENRSWTPTIHATSKRQTARIAPEPLIIAVHAGAAWWSGLKTGGGKTCPKLRPDVAAFVRERWVGDPVDLAALPTSAVLGAMRIVNYLTPEELHAEAPGVRPSLPWALGPWCWMVDRVWVLDEPIPAAGSLGLWPLARINGGDAERIVQALVKTPGRP